MTPDGATESQTYDKCSTLLVFRLGEELIALDVRSVREIVDPLPMAAVPGAPSSAPGLVNVRGSIVTVLDLRARLGLRAGTRTRDSRLVVTETAINDDAVTVAFEADAVVQVLEIPSDRIEPVPEIGVSWPSGLLGGIFRHDDALVTLLDAVAALAPTAPGRGANPCS